MFDEKHGNIPSLEDILALAEEDRNGAYTEFIERFIPCVVGKSDWDDNSSKKLIEELVNPSDEALAILLLENSWELWLEVATQLAANPGCKESELKLKSVKTKWTSQGRPTAFGGWPIVGLRRYNELYNGVAEDRAKKERYIFEEQFKSRQLQKKNGSAKKRKSRTNDKEDLDFTVSDDVSIIIMRANEKVAAV